MGQWIHLCNNQQFDIIFVNFLEIFMPFVQRSIPGSFKVLSDSNCRGYNYCEPDHHDFHC